MSMCIVEGRQQRRWPRAAATRRAHGSCWALPSSVRRRLHGPECGRSLRYSSATIHTGIAFVVAPCARLTSTARTGSSLAPERCASIPMRATLCTFTTGSCERRNSFPDLPAPGLPLHGLDLLSQLGAGHASVRQANTRLLPPFPRVLGAVRPRFLGAARGPAPFREVRRLLAPASCHGPLRRVGRIPSGLRAEPRCIVRRSAGRQRRRNDRHRLGRAGRPPDPVDSAVTPRTLALI